MTDKPHYLGHRKRLKERFSQDPEQLADYELLELILGYGLPRKDTKPLAKELLSRFGTIKGVLKAKPSELREINGFGPGLELFWRIWSEFLSRTLEASLPEKLTLSNPKPVVDVAISRLGNKEKEEFWIALVDNKNRLISFKQAFEGTVDQTAVYPREILSLALEHKASGFILVHNHPGGDPSPSSQDRTLTHRLEKLSSELGLRLLDHIIVAEEKYLSFKAEGLL
jgi:DNA repair protein RadC